MKYAQKNIILQRFVKLIFCGGFILTLSACGLKGPLYMPPETQPAQTSEPVVEKTPESIMLNDIN